MIRNPRAKALAWVNALLPRTPARAIAVEGEGRSQQEDRLLQWLGQEDAAWRPQGHYE